MPREALSAKTQSEQPRRKQLKTMMIFVVMLAMLFLCENVSAESEGFNVGFMVKYGCYKKECYAYCGQSWTRGTWCFLKARHNGKYIDRAASCEDDQDCADVIKTGKSVMPCYSDCKL
ncbi:uncharacterized protein LOC130636447 [Hydractinia symbiolongicarpus]|uniref:uncharacterized protein LOC130636447 n=1 Tax=Hydractinia symbiolongicarpus TaxID=13093 RepID=UPI00254BD1BE|nr:uncharacterized protein LOC130636447 [Hydractinia symbiolongicarpus]